MFTSVFWKLRKDFFIALAITFVTFGLFVITDFVELWFEFTRAHEEYELDELLGLVLGGSVGLVFLSVKLLNYYKADRNRIYALSKDLDFQANYDQLTLLPNRSAFKTFTRELIQDATKLHNRFTLFYVDLDSFKYINDMLGYTIGDSLLVEVTRRLNSVIDETASLSRIGGDEFCILLPGYTNDSKCLEICSVLNEQIAKPFLIDGHKLYVSQTIGISRFPEDGTTYEQLLRIADIAMFMGKSSRHTPNNFKDNQFIADMNRRFIVQHGLADALTNKEFFLVYQPQIDLSSGEIVSSEALVRWQHPVHGIINPDEFINVAEETFTIHLIDLYVLESVCEQLQHWGAAAKPVSVNFSPALFADEGFAQKVFDMLDKYDVPNHLIKLEITERTIVADSHIPLLVCKRLNEAGILISLDDFGTGYSSLAHLADYPISEIKVDRSFINQIVDNEKTRNIVSAIINLARALNIKIVAEGIETEEQFNMSWQLGCTMAQGYYIGRPAKVDQFSHNAYETENV